PCSAAMMSCHQTSTWADDYSVQQENELEALVSMILCCFLLIKIKRPLDVYLCLRPNGLSNGKESYVTVDLQVHCPPTFPDVPPEFELKNAKGLSNDNLQSLQTQLTKLAAERCGEMMIYELADHVQGFLSEHNKPPFSSFHEEMLKNQRLQQERLALEEQEKLDQRRSKEEQTQFEIMAEIQRREEEKQEEKRKKDIAKQLTLHAVFVVTRRDTYREDSPCSQEVLYFSNSTLGDLLVHRGKCLSVRLGRNVYNAFDATNGEFAIVYEWILRWNKKIGKFFTSEEKGKIDNCKKQVSNSYLSKRLGDLCKEDIVQQARVRFCEDTLPTKAGKKGDVWSLGLMLLALSQGEEVREFPVSVPTSLPADFQDFLNRCVCLNDADRWNTQQLFDHPFLNPPPPKTPPHGLIHYVESHILNAPFSTGLQRQFSRYFNEFEELQLLGKGAFGTVIKVQNKLDGCYYAVKRIQVNPASKQFRRIKGEVTLLSRLNHENIVRYYNAWIERHETPSTGILSSDSTEPRRTAEKLPQVRAPSLGPNELGIGMLDNVEGNASPPAPASSVEWSTSIEMSSSAKCSGHESSDEDDDVFCASFLVLSSLQMEYCEKSTLLDTIDQGLHQDNSRLWRFFREILDGLAYIHQQGMIHRDLKPVNIFLDAQDHVKIGDFGLATDHPASVVCLNVLGFRNMTGMVGTALYVSPEVQGNTNATYNQKVDLFSLGIVLFEMSYRPMTTGSERISVLSQLRMVNINFPEDFPEYKSGTQMKVIGWLLNHDPALHSTAQELLKSDLLPPPQMEESELHEVLQHTMANVNGKAYRTMVNQLFSQITSPVMDYTYDIDLHKGNFHFNSARLQPYVYETITRIFKKHGAVRLQTPLLLPRNRKLYEGSEPSCLMDHSGMLVTLPYDLRIAFARFVARNNITHFKRWCIKRVFRPRKLDRAHPRELLECSFDVIVPVTNSLLPDAETIFTISEIIQEFSVLQERNYHIYLNHTSLLKAVLLHILSVTSFEKLTRREVEAKFCNLSLSNNSLQTLYKYIEQKGDLQDLVPLITSLTKQKTAVTQLAKQGLKDLEALTGLLRSLGVKLQVVVNLGLVYKVQHHCGVIFQFVAFIKKRRRAAPDIMAAGGRYDHLILEFRGPASSAPVHSAVGASLALDKVCAALASMEEPPSISSCDVLVVPVGHISMGRAINVVQKLWTAGVSTDIVYDVSQSQETMLEHCRQAGITCMALVSDKDGNYIKVKSSEKEKQSEKRIPESDLVDHIVQKCRTKFFEERNIRETSETVSLQNTKGSLVNASCTVEHSASSNINVLLISPEKVSSSARRRYETQVCQSITPPCLFDRSHYVECLIAGFSLALSFCHSSLQFDGDEQFNNSVKHLLSRLPKQRYLRSICEELHCFKILKRYSTLQTEQIRDNYSL
uniref:non-specific serine/threonine protein kinase n=1 Tax=Oncorhynchus tshawytscha TaxID=74940 RepID=A0AAZ3R7R4_ONCTS